MMYQLTTKHTLKKQCDILFPVDKDMLTISDGDLKLSNSRRYDKVYNPMMFQRKCLKKMSSIKRILTNEINILKLTQLNEKYCVRVIFMKR